MIFSRQETNVGKKTKCGLGWFIHDTRDRGTERQFEHSGGVAGSSSWLVIYPDQGVVIAWMQNNNDFRDWPIANVSAPFFLHRKVSSNHADRSQGIVVAKSRWHPQPRNVRQLDEPSPIRNGTWEIDR